MLLGRLRDICAVLAFSILALAPLTCEADTLVIGAIGKDVKDELKEFTALSAFLNGKLAALGVDKVEALVVPTASRMAEAIRAGKVHLFIDSPAVAARMARATGVVPFLRRWKKGVAEYHSEIVVRSELPIHSLDDLRGQVIAFEDPDSTSGHLLPRAMLHGAGLAVEILRRGDSEFDRSKVGAVFMMADRSAILSLLNGRVAAAAIENNYLPLIEKEYPGAVRSIARSIVVPRHVVTRAPDLPMPLVEKITGILTGMHESEDGRRALHLFGRTDRFDHFPKGVDATFGPLLEQLQILDDHLPVSSAMN
jgi:phosphonate transport system substrate-binding protein